MHHFGGKGVNISERIASSGAWGVRCDVHLTVATMKDQLQLVLWLAEGIFPIGLGLVKLHVHEAGQVRLHQDSVRSVRPGHITPRLGQVMISQVRSDYTKTRSGHDQSGQVRLHQDSVRPGQITPRLGQVSQARSDYTKTRSGHDQSGQV